MTAVATAAIGLCMAVWQVGVLRALAWVSRGVRSPARDSLLISITPTGAYGRASGLERAGDNAGAILGPLLAALLVGVVGIRHAILLAFIPGGVRGHRDHHRRAPGQGHAFGSNARRALSFNFHQLWRAGLPRALTPAALFELGNLATTLLILREPAFFRPRTRAHRGDESGYPPVRAAQRGGDCGGVRGGP